MSITRSNRRKRRFEHVKTLWPCTNPRPDAFILPPGLVSIHTYTATPAAGGWVGAVMSWAGAVMIWAWAVKAVFILKVKVTLTDPPTDRQTH